MNDFKYARSADKAKWNERSARPAPTSRMTAGLVGVRPLDPATFGAAALLLLVCAAAAGYVPARRAARVDPVVTLRSE